MYRSLNSYFRGNKMLSVETRLIENWAMIEKNLKKHRELIKELELKRSKTSSVMIDPRLKDIVIKSLIIIFDSEEKIDNSGNAAVKINKMWISVKEIINTIEENKEINPDNINMSSIYIGYAMRELGFIEKKRTNSGIIRLIDKDYLDKLVKKLE